MDLVDTFFSFMIIPSGGSRISQGRGPNLLFDIFTEKCIKMKEFVPRGGRDRPVVVDPRMGGGTPPYGSNIFLISCSFWENLANLYVGAPSYGEFWIRPPGQWKGTKRESRSQRFIRGVPFLYFSLRC